MPCLGAQEALQNLNFKAKIASQKLGFRLKKLLDFCDT